MIDKNMDNLQRIAYLLLADGFEEIEALAPVDLLRRAGVTVQTVSITSKRTVTGARGVPVVADITIDEVEFERLHTLILPGGYPGYENLGNSPLVCDLLKKTFAANRQVAAICGAPSVPGKLGLLEGYTATIYPGMEADLHCTHQEAPVVVDRNLITSRGAGTAIDFALALVGELVSPEKAEELRKGIVYR